jgi:hypothetical protein
MRRHGAVLLVVPLLALCGQTWAENKKNKSAETLSPQVKNELFMAFVRLAQVAAGATEAGMNKIETGTRDLARQRAAARREGIPLTLREFQRASPPPELDAAPIYIQLTRLLKQSPLDKGLEASALRIGFRYRYTPEDVAAARKLLAQRQDVMTLVHQATDRPQCVFHRDWMLGAALLRPEYTPARAGARLLKIESFLLALDGHYAEAIANQARGLRIASHIAQDGTLLAYLVGISCEAIALAGMQDVIFLSGTDPDVMDRVRATIADNRPTYSLRRALQGEVMMQVGLMHQCRQLGPQTIFSLSGDHSQAEAKKLAEPWEDLPAGRRYWKLLADAAEADMLCKMRKAFAVIQRPYFERMKLAQPWLESLGDRSMGLIGIFGAVMLPVLDIPDEKAMHARAEEDAVMAGAAVLSYRARNGAWPDRLDEVLPRLPLDPFTLRPLRYRRDGDGFVIYSLGPSGVDDGGQAPVPGNRWKQWKAVFRYPAPPPQQAAAQTALQPLPKAE